MWRLFCPYLFLISLSFGVSGGLCFVVVGFPGDLPPFLLVLCMHIFIFYIHNTKR